MRAHLFFRSGDSTSSEDRLFDHVATFDVGGGLPSEILAGLRTATGSADWRGHSAAAWATTDDIRPNDVGDVVVLEDARQREAYELTSNGWVRAAGVTARRTGPQVWTCDDCGASIAREYYMVQNDLWLDAMGSRDGHLCLGCLEVRAGRRLVPTDFPDVPVNTWPRIRPSERESAPQAGLLHYPVRDRDVPIYWSERLLDRLGVGGRYARYVRGRAEVA